MVRRWNLLLGGTGLLLSSLIVYLIAAADWLVPHESLQVAADLPAAQQQDSRGTGPTKELLLAEAERQYLWDVEHCGQLLSQRGFKQLVDALRKYDFDDLLSRFSDEFRGSELEQPREIEYPGEFLKVVRKEDRGRDAKPLSRDEFVIRLLDFRERFAKPPGVKFSLRTLSPKDRKNLDGRWEGTCELRMWGESGPKSGEHGTKAPLEITASLRYEVNRPTEELFHGVGWLQACSITQILVAESRAFLLRDVSKERGVDPGSFHDNWNCDGTPPIIQTGGVYLCDYNRDGYLDMLLLDVDRHILNQGLPDGKFSDVTHACGLPGLAPNSSIAAAIADLDGDGWEDLILGNRKYQNEPDEAGGRRFADVTASSNVNFGKATSLVITDYDRDGRLDIYATMPGTPKTGSWVDGKSGDSSQNRLFRNLGNWQFADVTEISNTAGGNRSCFTASWMDANNDGWPDVYVINEFGPGVLLVNQGNGTFREQLLAHGPADFGSMGVAAGDIDNDGNIDLYTANMYSKAGTRVIGNLRPDAYSPDIMETMRHFVIGSQLWLNQGNLKFQPKGKDWQVAAVGWAYGPALVDFDNDGFLDIYATAGFISQDRSEPDG